MKLTDLQEVAGIAASVFASCVIGGGAPRDAFLGGPIKDIDVFVDTRHDLRDFMSSVETLAQKLNGSCSYPQAGTHEYDEEIVDIALPGGIPPLQIIPISRCPFTDVYDYDFGLSQILMTPKGALRTDAFDSDVRANTITYMGDESWDAKGRERSAKRLLRIRKKYPSFFPINCDILGVGAEQ
ncbi:hypothetical protein [Variovorax paradoxus]|uniref:hypothetical protein n=1 Tax=Variovorax paradoxus TaxID=34073 RepID=UPI00285663A4|nr:hypothetical protein [Variovorax paradoxus]MDR6455510.1 hypothetical protein [Variovorax paradoxus]